MKDQNRLHKCFPSATLNLIAKHTRYSELSLFAILVLSVLLSGCSGLLGKKVVPMASADDALTFEEHEIVTGPTKHQTVLTGFFLGGNLAELAVVNSDGKGNRYLRIYAFDEGTWALRFDTTLRSDVLFVDVAKINGRDRLIMYEHGRLNWFDPNSAVERALVEVTTNYKATDDGRISYVDITRDVNGDDLDDIVVPNIDGFWIATQLPNGSFSDPIKLGPSEPLLDETALGDTHSYREVGITPLTVFWYLSRLHQMDYDQDGRSDLVFWNTDHFDVYCQDDRGMFSPIAETFTVDIPFDSDGAYSIAFEFNGENMFSLIFGFRETTKRRVLHTFRDLNGDSVADLVIHSLEGRSLGKQRSLYEIYFGTPTPDGTVFAQEISITIQPRGTAGGLQPWGYSSQWLQDFDGDGEVDILFRNIQTGLVGMSRAMVGNSISMDLEFYRMEDGVYPREPTTKRKIRPAFAPFNARGVFFPAVLLGDVNGDRRSDLLVGKNWEEMYIFLGVPGPELLAQIPEKIRATMPNDERNIWLVDINADDKQDILLYYPSTTESHRVTLLITK